MSKAENFHGASFRHNHNSYNEIVILCHGFASNKNLLPILQIESHLIKKGYSTLSFDWYGHGRSISSFRKVRIETCEIEIATILRKVREMGYKKITIIAHSAGAYIVSRYFERTGDKVDRCIFIAPALKAKNIYKNVIDLKNWWNPLVMILGLFLWIKKDSNLIKSIKESPEITSLNPNTLIIHGDKDPLVSVDGILKYSSYKGVEIKILEGADHTFALELINNKLLNIIDNFLKK